MNIRSLTLVIVLAAAWTPTLADVILREDTASQAVVLGPFVDSTDGNTAETALTIDAADVRLSKNGANIVGKNSGGCTHDELGYYTCTFDATDTSDPGRLQVMVHESGALPVYHEFQVVEEAVYDACCVSGATVQSFPTNFASMAITGGGAVTAGTVSDKTGYSIGTGGIVAASFGSGAIDASAIAADAIGSSELAASAGTELGTATWASTTRLLTAGTNIVLAKGTGVTGFNDLDAAGIRASLGLASADLDSQLNGIDAIVDQLLIGVNVSSMNGVAVTGAGTEADPWNGAE